jgi:hypothetical protein
MQHEGEAVIVKAMSLESINKFIISLPSGNLTKNELLVPELLISEQEDLRVYYAPFDFTNEQAKITIVGITPGFTQMELAIRTARQDLLDGFHIEEISSRVKRVASFAGSMRKNLLSMLDDLGIPEVLEIDSSNSLFNEDRELLHTTSVIKYPVFKKEQKYTGHSPEILKSNLLSSIATELFIKELCSAPSSLIYL